MSVRRIFTAAEIALVREHYPDGCSAALCAQLSCTIHQLYYLAFRCKVYKSKIAIARLALEKIQHPDHPARLTQFKKGFVPHNKGKSYPMVGRMGETQFKKGCTPQNYRPIGDERVVDGYLQRKVTDTGYPPRDWVPVHVFLWRELRGEIPPKHVVYFLDNNKQNITIENLAIRSRADHMRANSLHRYPKEIAKLIQLRGAVNRKINQRTKDDQRSDE